MAAAQEHKASKPPRLPDDPYGAFKFKVSVAQANGVSVIAGFSDVTGLGAENDVETLRVGGMNDTEWMLPGPAKFPSRLVLKRGLGDPAVLWAWYLKVLQGAIARADVTIEALRIDGSTGHRWTFSQACPVKWTGPEFHAGTAAVAFESIELIHRGFLAPAP
jgi:phage tail-like protein